MPPKHIKEFSKNAHTYDLHTSLQRDVARYLLSRIEGHPRNVLDLGCGSGAVYKQLPWEVECFVGVDSAETMCASHPKAQNIMLMCQDFDSTLLWEALEDRYELGISSSALQWSCDIEALLKSLSLRCQEGAFAIFTDKTFYALYAYTGLESFLPNAQNLKEIAENYFTCKSEIKTFQLFFEDTLSLFRYIKQSGVSGGEKKLSVAQTRNLIQNYPQRFLEFEVLFLWGKSKHI